MELVLIRHAEPERVAPGEVDGPVDPGLTSRGVEQARRLARWLAADGVDHVVVSPMRRAVETAAPLVEALGQSAQVDDRITEYDHRADHYIPVEELRVSRDERWLAMIEGRWQEFGADDPDTFRARIVPALEEIVTAHPGERVVVIGHGGVINVYTAHVLELDRLLWADVGYTSITRVAAARTGERSLLTLNETAHLVAVREEVVS